LEQPAQEDGDAEKIEEVAATSEKSVIDETAKKIREYECAGECHDPAEKCGAKVPNSSSTNLQRPEHRLASRLNWRCL